MKDDEINKYVGRARTSQFTKDDIATYYYNAEERDAPEAVLKAIETRIRSDFPGLATRMFGQKAEQFVELLTRIAHTMQQEFPLHKNRVGSHVKTGGEEINGNYYLWRYISYKNEQHRAAEVSLVQEKADSEAYIVVAQYQTNAGEKNFKNTTRYPLGEIEQAQAQYRQYLQELVTP